MGYLYGVDVSWPNGNYYPGPESFVGVGAVSLDGGSPFVQTTYRQQVSNARNAGKEVIHYAFNGRTTQLSPAGFADYFVANLYDYRPGDGLALDVESSETGTFPAWTPGQATEFRDRLQSRITTRMGVYGNRTDMGKAGWGALKATGTWLWIAWPGDESYLSSIGDWGNDWSIWQYSSAGGLDRNYAKTTIAALAGINAQEGAMAFEMISNGQSINFCDEFGTENIANYMSPDIQIGEFVDAANTVFGTYKTVTSRQFDIAVAISERRRKVVEARLASNAAQQVLASIGTDIGPTIAAALQQAGIGGTTAEQIKTITDAITAAQQAVVASIPTAFAAQK